MYSEDQERACVLTTPFALARRPRMNGGGTPSAAGILPICPDSRKGSITAYAESLIVECSFGKDAAIEFLNNQKDGVKNREPVTGVYNVNHIFYDIGDMYSKGSLMLNTFRPLYSADSDTLPFAFLNDIQQQFRITRAFLQTSW